MSVPAMLYEFILQAIDVTLITRHTILSAVPYTKTTHFKRDTRVTRVKQGCYMSVPAMLYEFILQAIDVTLITRYFRPYLTLKLHIISVTLLLQGCNRAVT